MDTLKLGCTCAIEVLAYHVSQTHGHITHLDHKNKLYNICVHALTQEQSI